MLIKLTIEQSYNEVVFIFNNMHEASSFIEIAMEHASKETKYHIEEIKPIEADENTIRSADILAEDEG